MRVKGVGDLMIRFAKCCSPDSGRSDRGYITRGHGVTVHLPTCPTVVNEREIGRLIEVEWEPLAADLPDHDPRSRPIDRPGLLSEITNVIAENKVNIVAASIGVHPDGMASITATLKVTSLQQLSRVLTRIERVRDVTSVTREVG